MKIEITEGCICYSYLIDGKEYVNLIDSDHKDYNPDAIKKAFKLLIKRAENRNDNSIWDRLFCYLNDYLIEEVITNYINTEIEKGNLLDLQGMFIELVERDPDVRFETSGPCGCCGDLIFSYTLEIKG